MSYKVHDYRKTIRAMADADMNVAEAARLLYLHRGTVVYRLKQIHQQTGLDPYRFHDLCKLLKMCDEGVWV